MLFMNKKEEVLDIELTPHGKRLLSMGKMKPVYYSFFDDNILYDSEYAGLTEDQNIIQDRITVLTPQLQTQYKFTSDVMKGIDVDFGNGEKVSTIAPLERNVLVNSLGSTRMSGENYPAINIRMLNGRIGSYDLDYKTEFGQKKIPQLNIDIEYRVKVKNVRVTGVTGGSVPLDDTPAIVTAGDSPTAIIITDIAPDGSYLSIDPGIVLADIIENNTDFKLENFDIEVYEVGETLIPLSFAKNKKNNVVNNILVDPISIEDEIPVELSSDNVEYYFNIFLDSDIDREIINNSVNILKSQGLYTDKDFVKEDNVLIREAVSNIYGTNVTATDIKDC